jgi:hypothetical protein
MTKLPQCDRCHFYARSNQLVCAIHPYGVTGDSCLDFRPVDLTPYELEYGTPVLNSYSNSDNWCPDGYSYYDGELMYHQPRLTTEEQLYLIDHHPFFTGHCPNCNYQFDRNNPPTVHWDCPHCGWIDDSV